MSGVEEAILIGLRKNLRSRDWGLALFINDPQLDG